MIVRIVLMACCLFGTLAAQPVFSPPVRPVAPQPERSADNAPAQKAPQDATQPPNPVDALLQRLASWPQPRAKEAALVLSGLGGEATPRLLAGLSHNDWRVQSGCAWALGEMHELSAVTPLRLAISDPSNRAGLPDLMAALVRIDPQAGTAAVLPMLTHASARVRQAASRALPQVVSEQYLGSILALLGAAKGPGKATALELLGRVPGAGQREEFFACLADPEPTVAATAALHLGKNASAEVRARLSDVARNGPARCAAYALLALTEDEDLHGGSAIPADEAVRARLQQWLVGSDPFPRASAAVVLANITYGSAAPADRKLANELLVPVLIDAVAGGVFYSDYTSIEPFVWRKLALLTGRSFGQDAFSWKRWWGAAASEFRASRELRSLSSEDAGAALWTVQRVVAGRVQATVLLGGPALAAARVTGGVVLLDTAGVASLVDAFAAAKFFATRGDSEGAQTQELWITVALPEEACRFRRITAGIPAADIEAIATLAERLALERGWQAFVQAADPAARVALLKTTAAALDALPQREERAKAIAELALTAWSQLSDSARTQAAAMLCAMDAAWCKGAAERIAASLQLSGIADAGSAALGARVIAQAGVATKLQLLEAALRGSAQDKLLTTLLAALDAKDLAVALSSEQPRIRAAAAAVLGASGAIGAAEQLLAGLRDDDTRVREACLAALAGMSDSRTAALIEGLLISEDRNLRNRAIMALGAVMREQGVARAMEFWHSGERPEKAAVLKALAAAGGPRAAAALHGIVRETGDLGLRREALETLSKLSDCASQLRDVLEHADVPDLRVMALTALAQQLQLEAVPLITPWLSAAEPPLARAAALALARLGEVQALPALLSKLLQAPEGDQAVELALEGLTFQVAHAASPPRRAEEFRIWNEASGQKTRGQWFLDAAAAAGVPLDAEADWLSARGIKPAQLDALVVLVEKGTDPLRAEADRILRLSVVSEGAALKPLGLRSSPAEASERAAAWRARLTRDR